MHTQYYIKVDNHLPIAVLLIGRSDTRIEYAIGLLSLSLGFPTTFLSVSR